MAENAGIWQRVSTGAQDEASQLPDLTRWCEARGYEIAARYVLHGKSASKGKHDKYLDQVISDMQDGKITVLVVWASSRIERRGAYNAFDLARRVREAGGRIEYVKDAYLNDANEMSDVMLALAATKDRQESKDKTDRTLAKQAALRAAGSVVGRAPWGYKIESHGNVKILVPTPDGRKYIPVIFQMIIDGKSLRDVAGYLTDEHVSGKTWNENYIALRLVKNPVYYGQRRNSGQLETEPLVSYSTWQEANAKVTSRARPGRTTSTHAKVLLSPVCGNPDCDATGSNRDSPMYRSFGGYGVNRKAYYRCTGRGPQRKGCGNMIPVDELDQIVIEALESDHMNQHYEHVFIPGDDRSDEVGKLREAAMDAYRKGDKARFMELDTQADELAALPSVAPHWEDHPAGISEGEYFASLNEDQRREHIAAACQIIAWKHDDGTPGVTVFPRDWL